MKHIKLILLILVAVVLCAQQVDYFSAAIKNEGATPQYSQATATSTAAQVSLSPGAIAIKLFNRSTSVDLLYSYDGATYFSLPPRASLVERVKADDIYLKTASGTAAYDLKAALRQ